MAATAQEALGQLDQLDAVLAGLAAVAPAELDSESLVQGIGRLLEAETRLRATQAAWLAVADSGDAVVEETGRPAGSWLIEERRLSAAESRRRMRLARGVAAQPAVAAAMADGAISIEQAHAVLHALGEVPLVHVPALETALLDIARDGTVLDVRRAVDEVRARVIGETAEERSLRRYADRHLQLDETFAGTGSLSATLSNECRETLRLALQAASGLRGPDDTRTVPQRQHDALHDIAAFYLSHADEVVPEAGERPRIVVTIPYAELTRTLGRQAHAGDDPGTPLPVGMFDSGAPVSAATVRRLACDAQILPAVLGGPSERLDLGRSVRSFSLAVRRAAKLRDGARCARHGCRRRIVDCHHIVFWSRGGRSDLENAVWLCAFHHWLVHERGWSLRRLGPGRYVFTDPQGREHGPPPDTGDPPHRRSAA